MFQVGEKVGTAFTYNDPQYHDHPCSDGTRCLSQSISLVISILEANQGGSYSEREHPCHEQ